MNYKNTAFEGNWAPSTCATFELSEIKSYEEANSQFVAGEPDLLSCFCYDKFKTLTFGILTNDALLELGGGENPCTYYEFLIETVFERIQSFRGRTYSFKTNCIVDNKNVDCSIR
jgi:hypothetical protein